MRTSLATVALALLTTVSGGCATWTAVHSNTSWTLYVKDGVPAYLADYEQNVIRPHALGRFPDMLRAVARSGAMLLYLDNWVSYGPESPAARAAR